MYIYLLYVFHIHCMTLNHIMLHIIHYTYIALHYIKPHYSMVQYSTIYIIIVHTCVGTASLCQLDPLQISWGTFGSHSYMPACRKWNDWRESWFDSAWPWQTLALVGSLGIQDYCTHIYIYPVVQWIQPLEVPIHVKPPLSRPAEKEPKRQKVEAWRAKMGWVQTMECHL